jgi:very-short-patch-repair endonuclease
VLPQFGRAAREIVADLALLHERPLDRCDRQEIVEPASPADFAAATVALQNLVALRNDIPTEAMSTVGGLGTTRASANPNSSAAEFKELVERLGQQIDVASSAVDELKQIGVNAPTSSLAELAEWSAEQPNLSLANDARDVELAARLHRHGGREAYERLSSAKQEMRGILEAYPDARRHGQSLVVHDTASWGASRRAIEGSALAHVGMESIGRLGQSFAAAERQIKETLLSGAGTASAEALSDAPGYAAWRGRLVLIGQIEQGLAHVKLLCASFGKGSPSASQVADLIAAIRRATSAHGAAGRRLAINLIPGIEELERLQAVLCPQSGVLGRAWAFVSSKDYRQCRAAFRSMIRLPIKRREWDSEIQGAVELRRAEQALKGHVAAWGFSGDPEHVDALESAASWMSGIERSAQVAQVTSETTWAMMRDRHDSALEATERQIGRLCAKFAREGQLLQAMSAVAGNGGFRLQRFVRALADAGKAAELSAKQATAWGLRGDMNLGAILALGAAAARAREIELICADDADARELVGVDFAGVDSALSRLEVVATWHAAAIGSSRPDWKRTIATLLTERSTAPERMARLKDRAAAIARTARAACQLCEQIGASFEMRGDSARLRLKADQSPRALAHFVRAILECQASIPKVFRHHASALAARPLVGSALIDRYLDGSVDCSRITESYQAAAYEYALRQRDELTPLVDFDRTRLERALAELRDSDDELRRSNAAVLRGRLASTKAPQGVDVVRVRDKTELSLIRHVIQTPKARLDLTGLYRRAGTAIRVLQPCTIATPTTVSEYLPRRLADFDLVIIDEASQVEPASAIGSIARGAQVIIVGDPKQLPPTNFFGGAKATADDGDHTDPDGVGDGVADTESILDRAIASLTNVHLRGHYRSKHHSLIEFSNRQFYDSQLVVPPSTGPRTSKLGVVAHHVDGAFYSASENEVEATAVAEAVLRHLRTSPEESIGVVAFNVRQADLIERNIMACARRSREDFEAYAKACGGDAPLFVRSLESVQGDQRDVIFISYTYGRDPIAKVVYQRFGPLTQQGGGRRLNVLVTRARKRVEVFHSLIPDDITADTGGVPLMRAYLHHAMRAPQHDFSEGNFESAFEAQVAAMIVQINPNLVVRPQVGCEGFRIDLGIALQSSPHRFILGVECDGATYHSEPSARQRDMIRQTILEQHGWTIHRIWSTAWWHNFAEERSRLVKAIERAVSGCEEDPVGSH